MTDQKEKRLASLGKQNAAKPEGSHMKMMAVTVRPDQVPIFKELGGSRWLRDKIDKSILRLAKK